MILYMFTKVQIITSNLKFQKTDWKEQVRKCMNNVTITVQTLSYSLQYVSTTPCAKKGNMKIRHDRDGLQGSSSTELISSNSVRVTEGMYWTYFIFLANCC